MPFHLAVNKASPEVRQWQMILQSSFLVGHVDFELLIIAWIGAVYNYGQLCITLFKREWVGGCIQVE